MNAPDYHTRPAAEADRLAGLARVIRRICLLREQGEAAEAKRMQESDLGNAIRDFRLAHGPAAFTDADLGVIFQREEERVANAAVLAEILIPQLAAVRPPAVGPTDRAIAASAVLSPAREAGSVIPFSPDVTSAPPSRAPAIAGSPAIPDLLDAMLAAERNGRRATATQRQ